MAAGGGGEVGRLFLALASKPVITFHGVEGDHAEVTYILIITCLVYNNVLYIELP